MRKSDGSATYFANDIAYHADKMRRGADVMIDVLGADHGGYVSRMTAVWLVPLMIWLLHGPLSARTGARVLGWGWLALTVIGVPWLLSFAQPTIWQGGRPWYLAWAGLVYIVAALATLAWMASTRVSTPKVAGDHETPQTGS